MFSILRRCSCLGKEPEDVKVLDFKHCGLSDVPNEIFNFERTLEELYLDFNQIQDLPRPLFYCHELRKLGLSDNEIHSLPSAVASLINLEELDVCKNAILDIPDNIKLCKCLRILEASVNPLGKLPEGFTQLINLEELYLNDTFVDYLPANFGRLFKLKILELRENHLKCLPKSMTRLTELTRLDIGQNDFRELPEVVGNLFNLSELWCDCNRISSISSAFGNLKKLTYLDASKNRIESIPNDIENCLNLTDLTLSSNNLKLLPESIGCLRNLEILRLDDNRIQKIPISIGSMSNLEELVLSQNNIQYFPSSIGLLRKLHTLLADENILEEIPPEVGSCVSLTILSLRCNRLVSIPDEIGHNSLLRIINFSENRIRFLPYSLKKLKSLQALWLSENQNKPLIPLQGDIDIDTGQRVLTCYLLPQVLGNQLDDYASDADSFQLSVWEEQRPQRQHIKFAYDEKLDKPGKLIRNPTPYPKELKSHVKHARNQALKSKGGANYVNISSLTDNGENETTEAIVAEAKVSQLSENIKIKEAKVTKSTSPNSSFDTHDITHLHEDVKIIHRILKNDQENLASNNEKNDSNENSGSIKPTLTGEFINEIKLAGDVGVVKDVDLILKSENFEIRRSDHLRQNKGQVQANDMKINCGYQSDQEVYENLRKDFVVNSKSIDHERRLNKVILDGYASDMDSRQRYYNDRFASPFSPQKMGKAASVSTAVAKKLMQENNFNRPSLLNSHNNYFFKENNERQEMDLSKSRNVYHLTYGPPPDLLPRNTGQMVIDGKNSMMYSPMETQQAYAMNSSISSLPHNPVPLPPRRRPTNLNLYQVASPSQMPNFNYSPQIASTASNYYLRPSPPSPYSVHGPPSPNRTKKPPPYHIATTYSKRAFISPPSPVSKSSVSYRPPSPLLTNSRLTTPPPAPSTSVRRSCHGSDPALSTRSNTPPSPFSTNNGSFRPRSHSSVNGAIVFDNPYVEEASVEKRSYPPSPTKTNWSSPVQKPRCLPNMNSNDGRRGSLSAPSTPPLPNTQPDYNPNVLLPSYRTPPLYPSDSVGSLNGSTSGDIGESNKFVGHKKHVANGYHISGPRWPATSDEDSKYPIVREQQQCGIFTAFPVLVKSCSGADINVDTTESNINESSGSTIFTNLYASTGHLR